MSVEWIKELCPEIAEWQAEMIWEQWQSDITAERDACTQKIFESVIDAAIIERNECARMCEAMGDYHDVAFAKYDCAEAIRSRGKR